VGLWPGRPLGTVTAVNLAYFNDRMAQQARAWVRSDPLGRRTFGDKYRPPTGIEVSAGKERIGYLISRDGGAQVGFLEVEISAGEATIGFYVLPSARCHEVGRDALKLLAADLRRRDVEVMTASVHPADRSALAFCGAGGLKGEDCDERGEVQLRRWLGGA
jgi:ribosomal protein S18 acetylase RimI-like enzyme